LKKSSEGGAETKEKAVRLMKKEMNDLKVRNKKLEDEINS